MFLLFCRDSKKHLIISPPPPPPPPQPFSKWLRELPACHLPLRGSRSVCTCQHQVPWNVVLTWASTYSTFFWFYVFIFFNCTLQQSRIIVQYSVIVGRSLVWLETNLNPTMTILLFSSILWTKRPRQSSTSTRPVGQRQKGVMSRIQSKEAIFDRQHQNGELARLWWCPDCDSQKVQYEAPSTALQLACPATLHS